MADAARASDSSAATTAANSTAASAPAACVDGDDDAADAGFNEFRQAIMAASQEERGSLHRALVVDQIIKKGDEQGIWSRVAHLAVPAVARATLGYEPHFSGNRNSRADTGVPMCQRAT